MVDETVLGAAFALDGPLFRIDDQIPLAALLPKRSKGVQTSGGEI